MSTQAQATEIATTCLRHVAGGRYAQAARLFDATLAASLPAEALEQTWLRLCGQAGSFQAILRTRAREHEHGRTVTLTCRFEKGQIDIHVVVTDTGAIGGLATQLAATDSAYATPAYADPTVFAEREVIVGEGSAWPLPATLSLPHDSASGPGVVLVHGSGPLDRDETIGSNKPFRDLAWGLASRGIAVLRYEKRTKAYAGRLSPEQAASMTVQEEVVDDALAAVALLRRAPGLDPNRVFLLGHSLGATLAPRIAQQDPTIAGLVVMAGMTRPLEDTILDQVMYLATVDGPVSDRDAAEIESLKRRVARVKDPELSPAVPPEELPLNVPAAYWLALRGYRPAEVAHSLSLPMLVLQGGRDYQVSADADFPAWREALERKAGATLRLYPTLNHAFMAGEGPSTAMDYALAGHVSREVVDDIVRWIEASAKR